MKNQNQKQNKFAPISSELRIATKQFKKTMRTQRCSKFGRDAFAGTYDFKKQLYNVKKQLFPEAV